MRRGGGSRRGGGGSGCLRSAAPLPAAPLPAASPVRVGSRTPPGGRGRSAEDPPRAAAGGGGRRGAFPPAPCLGAGWGGGLRITRAFCGGPFLPPEERRARGRGFPSGLPQGGAEGVPLPGQPRPSGRGSAVRGRSGAGHSGRSASAAGRKSSAGCVRSAGNLRKAAGAREALPVKGSSVRALPAGRRWSPSALRPNHPKGSAVKAGKPEPLALVTAEIRGAGGGTGAGNPWRCFCRSSSWQNAGGAAGFQLAGDPGVAQKSGAPRARGVSPPRSRSVPPVTARPLAPTTREAWERAVLGRGSGTLMRRVALCCETRRWLRGGNRGVATVGEFGAAPGLRPTAGASGRC
ncbi:LOW QUALITY PROTEIN: uncharacterized protein LOC143168838 [Aptenodytes patagonicus]|uniref:LOW QUALITY PROTEIN: uncharacterized protein LOC143168838 n=1 Tax=Aptenodytes patagonicus TaxID=9234 RepID=UPI003F9FDE7D